MEIFIIITVALVAIVAAFWLGGYHQRKLNETLIQQNILLEKFSQSWASFNTPTNDLYSSIRSQQSSSLTTTMSTVIQLLQAIQTSEQANTLSQDQKTQIDDLINSTKTLTLPQ